MRLVRALILAYVCATVPAPAETILVLPFFNLSRSSGLDWIGESLSETLRETLAAHGMIVFNREDRQEAYRRLSIRAYSRLTKASVLRLAESLDADQVIFGSFNVSEAEGDEKSRGTLRITAQILNTRKVTGGPEYRETGALEDLARLQNRLAWRTLQILPFAGPLSEDEFRSSQPVVRIEAIESYIRGLLAGSADQKLKLFSQAVRAEPRYAQANFELGRLHYERKAYKPAAEALQKAAAAEVNSRMATFMLGLCRYRLGDFAGAEQAFQRVAEYIPLNEVWNNLGAAQSRSNSPSALDNFKKALEGDVNDPDYHFNVGYALLKRGDFAGASERFRAVLDRNPDDAEAIAMLGRSLKKTSSERSGRSETRTEGSERLKESYEESAYLQLKAVLQEKR